MVRPRTSVPDKEELIQLGEDLVEWSSKGPEECDGEIRCRYCQWFNPLGFIRTQWDLMLQKPEFRVYYELAQTNLSQRYVDGTINQSIAHRYLRKYDPELRDQEDADMKAKAEVAKDVQKQSTEEIKQKVDDLLAQVRSARKDNNN